MKFFSRFIFFTVAILYSGSIHAQLIRCVGEDSVGQASFENVVRSQQNRRPQFKAVISKELSVPYVGEVSDSDERILTFDKVASGPNEAIWVFSDWDGNSGIELRVPKNAHKSVPNEMFLATLKVYYNDIAEGEKTSRLNCWVSLN
ncbi:MAG: hypothetical protein IT289_03835 [Oligoflexia bacterium]|nr:hypothetical protein [Oligoflexia bacterium]